MSPTLSPVVVDKTEGLSAGSVDCGVLVSCFSFSCLFSQLMTVETEIQERSGVKN